MWLPVLAHNAGWTSAPDNHAAPSTHLFFTTLLAALGWLLLLLLAVVLFVILFIVIAFVVILNKGSFSCGEPWFTDTRGTITVLSTCTGRATVHPVCGFPGTNQSLGLCLQQATRILTVQGPTSSSSSPSSPSMYSWRASPVNQDKAWGMIFSLQCSSTQDHGCARQHASPAAALPQGQLC